MTKNIYNHALFMAL